MYIGIHILYIFLYVYIHTYIYVCVKSIAYMNVHLIIPLENFDLILITRYLVLTISIGIFFFENAYNYVLCLNFSLLKDF